MEIVGDEHPVEGRVEGDKDRLVARRDFVREPLLETRHRVRWWQTARGQFAKREPVNGHRFRDGIGVDGLQPEVKGPLRVGDKARAYGEQRILTGIWAGGLDVDGDKCFGKRL